MTLIGSAYPCRQCCFPIKTDCLRLYPRLFDINLPNSRFTETHQTNHSLNHNKIKCPHSLCDGRMGVAETYIGRILRQLKFLYFYKIKTHYSVSVKIRWMKYPGAQVHTMNNISLRFQVCSANGFTNTRDTN